MTIRNVIVACDYAYIEGGAARVAVQTAVELSKRSNLKVYFFAGCGDRGGLRAGLGDKVGLQRVGSAFDRRSVLVPPQ